jgi:hypothetical protein
MKIIAFAAAAVVIAAGSAVAGSDHFDPGAVLSTTSDLDASHTASVNKKTKSPAQGSALGTKATSPYNPADDQGRGHWGR